MWITPSFATLRGVKVAIYARLSDDRQGQSTGIDRQLEACRQFAAARDWTVVEEFSDTDLSAFRRGVVRPSYEEMLRRLPDVDVVLVWKLDRLVRRFLEFARVWPMFEEHRVALVSATEPIDTSSAIGRIIVLMLVGFAELESENISLRQRAKHGELRRLGKPSGGGRTPYPDQVMAEAAERIAAGESLRSVARAMGIANPSHLGRALKSPRLVGRRDGQEAENGPLRQIVPEATWRAAVAALSRHRQSGPGPARRHLLPGFLWCHCGGRMQAFTRPGKGRHYRCPRCFTSIKADPVDQLITEGVLLRIDDSVAVAEAIARRSAPGETPAIVEQLAADEEALADLSRARYVERSISEEEFRVARDPLVARIAQLRDRLQVDSSARVLSRAQGKARALWEGADLGWRRSLIAAVVDRVTILPATKRGPGLDPDRVEVSLRA